jgi:hypothetical protein
LLLFLRAEVYLVRMEILKETKECLIFLREEVPFAMQVPGGRFFIATMEEFPSFIPEKLREDFRSVGLFFDDSDFVSDKEINSLKPKHSIKDNVTNPTVLGRESESGEYLLCSFSVEEVRIFSAVDTPYLDCFCKEITFVNQKAYEMSVSPHEISDPTSGMNLPCNLVRMALEKSMNLTPNYEIDLPYWNGILVGSHLFAVFNDSYIFPHLLEMGPIFQIFEPKSIAVVDDDEIFQYKREFSIEVPHNHSLEKVCYRDETGLVIACSFGGRIYFKQEPVIGKVIFNASACQIERTFYLQSIKEQLLANMDRPPAETSIRPDIEDLPGYTEIDENLLKKPKITHGICIYLFFDVEDGTLYLPDEDGGLVGVRMVGNKRRYVYPNPEFVLCSMSRSEFADLFPQTSSDVIQCVFDYLFDGTLEEARNYDTDLGKALLKTFKSIFCSLNL